MAPSPIVQATLQTSILSAVANLLAQTITAHKDGVCNPFTNTKPKLPVWLSGCLTQSLAGVLAVRLPQYEIVLWLKAPRRVFARLWLDGYIQKTYIHTYIYTRGKRKVKSKANSVVPRK